MNITNPKRLYLECALIFGALPPIISVLKLHAGIHPILWLLAALAYYTLRHDHAYSFKRDWNFAALHKDSLKPMLYRWFFLALALLAFTIFMVPDKLFNLPLERPGMWILMMFLYPLLSVLPQEILYRGFFYARYRPIFSERTMIIVSSLAFGWMHIILQNWVAMTFSAIGGLLFGSTYLKNKSLAAAWLEHSLYGCWVFTLGLGVYFYHGLAVK